jgi:hypothetical protein
VPHVSAEDPTRLAKRARDLVEDLNLSTLGWRIPSQTLIEDFAGHEHGLRAQEHEITDISPAGDRHATRRAFSLYELDAEPGAAAPLVALLVEPTEGGSWSLLVAAQRGAGGPGAPRR